MQMDPGTFFFLMLISTLILANTVATSSSYTLGPQQLRRRRAQSSFCSIVAQQLSEMVTTWSCRDFIKLRYLVLVCHLEYQKNRRSRHIAFVRRSKASGEMIDGGSVPVVYLQREQYATRTVSTTHTPEPCSLLLERPLCLPKSHIDLNWYLWLSGKNCEQSV